jgi:hypothetical protein
MEIPLKQAPDRLFDQQKWSEFISHFDTREIALGRLSVHPSDPGGFYREGDAKLVKSDEGRWKQIDELYELGIALVGDFKTKLIKGQVLSSGISLEFDQNVEREPIASELWAKMWPDFVNDCAHGVMFGFTDVLVRRNDSRQALAAEMLERCILWLRGRAAEGENRRKTLANEALEHFGSHLHTRVFSAAYKEVFNKPRGRPRTKK